MFSYAYCTMASKDSATTAEISLSTFCFVILAIRPAIIASNFLLRRNTLSTRVFHSGTVEVFVCFIFRRFPSYPSEKPSRTRSMVHMLVAVLSLLASVCTVRNDGSCIQMLWQSVDSGSSRESVGAELQCFK